MHSQAFVMRKISCKFEISTYNTLCSRGQQKSSMKVKKNAHGSHLVFQNDAKNIPRQYFMDMNITLQI